MKKYRLRLKDNKKITSDEAVLYEIALNHTNIGNSYLFYGKKRDHTVFVQKVH